MDFQYLQRAKVYRLNEEGKWDDRGTGHVSVQYLERSDAVGLVVIDEDDNATLLVHRISADDMYKRQDDTIISWTDAEVGTDLALSFQEAMGCSYIWDQICNVRRNIHFPSVGALDVGPRSLNEDSEHSSTSQGNDDTYRDGVAGDALELPAVELSTLPQIVKIVTEISPSFLDRERLASLIAQDPNFLRKVVELFRVCEDLENMEGLHMIYGIVKGIVLLNDGRIFDIIFSDDYVMDVIGALEYDPDLALRQYHRTFLRGHAVFKEAVPFRDPGVLSKIHQTYRMGYIKDVILARVLDDQTFGTINAMILANNVAVVSALQDDTVFIKDIFARLRSPTISESTRKDLVRFLHEFCTLSKSLQPIHRIQLFSSLIREGLFEIVMEVLQGSDESIHVCGTDILIVVLNYDSSILRKFLSQQPDYKLLSLLVKGMLSSGESGLHTQLLEIMRMLLDYDNTEQVDKSPFLDTFYKNYMDQIMEVLSSAYPPNQSLKQNRKCHSSPESSFAKGHVAPEILGNICELLCFCVQHHSYHIKYYILKNNVLEKVLRLTWRKEKYLVVAAVRLLRTCVGMKDEFYLNYIVKNDIFEPVIQAFLVNGNRYNLLNSAILELFHFIRSENLKTLITYIVEKYFEKLEKVDFADNFRLLKLKYKQGLEGAAGGCDSAAATGGNKDQGRLHETPNENNAVQDPRKRKDERALDKDEEEYFNENSDDEDDTSGHMNAPSSHPAQAVILNGNYQTLRGPFGLVDYEDEDEDDDPPTTVNSDLNDRQLPRSCNLDYVARVEDRVSCLVQENEFENVKRKTNLQDAVKDDELDILKKRKMYLNTNGDIGRDVTRESVVGLPKRHQHLFSISLDQDSHKGGERMMEVMEETSYRNDVHMVVEITEPTRKDITHSTRTRHKNNDDKIRADTGEK